MPTSGDLKSGDCLFFTTPPPRISTTLPPTPQKIDPAGNDLGHYNDVLHDVHTIKIQNHRFDARNNLCQMTKYVQKCPRNRTTN